MNYATNRELLQRVGKDLALASDTNQRTILAQVHYIHRIVDAMLTESIDTLPTIYK